MKTLNQFFEGHVIRNASNPLMWEKRDGAYQASTYSEVRTMVYQFAAALMDLGIQKGDHLALLSEGRTAWLVSELGILYAGAVNIPLSIKLEPSDLLFRLNHGEAKILIISRLQLRKLAPIKDKLTTLQKVILLDPPAEGDQDLLYYDELMEKGTAYLEKNRDRFEERWQSVQPNDVANICYTSGTTADPKGIMLSHRNYTANTEQALTLMNIPTDYKTLLILPWDHSFGHTAGLYSFIASGASLAAVDPGKGGMDTLKNIPINIKEVRPDLLMSVPSLAKNFRKNIEKGIHDKGAFTEKLFKHALNVSYKHQGIGWDRGKGMRIFLKPLVALYDKILFSKIREVFGGKLKFFIGGGALLDIELQRFFYAIGIPMMQGYGLSESSPIISSNALHRHKLGSSGFLAKYLEVRILDDEGNELPLGEKGEIVVKGENVMLGYYKNPEASADALRDGWLHTGDLGYMDGDGFLYVLGRFKSLLIADDGEKYSPEGIEEAMTEQSKVIDQVMLFNNQRPYTVVLLYPNKEALKRAVKEKGADPSTAEGAEKALEILQSEVNEYRTGNRYGEMFPQRWLPAAVGVLSEGFTEDNKMMNSTMKMVRGVITETYHELIEFLYTPDAKNIRNPHNLQAIQKLLS
ncbi:MAG: AMP-dependent synthetase/ligase [Bacteroidota bacterium]